VRNHFHDLDWLKINRISIATVEKFITSRQVQGMNIATLRKILVTLGQILSFAVRRRCLDHNPLRFFPTKTKASNRKVDLEPTMLTELKRWKLVSEKNEFDLVFLNEAGKPMNNKNMLCRHFRPAIKAANCPLIRSHDLRHTNVSIRFANGESIKYVQTQLGHSSPSIPLNISTHLLKPTNQEAACRLENAILGEGGSKMVAQNEKGLRPYAVTP
jgi:site-specific recombinase XerD